MSQPWRRCAECESTMVPVRSSGSWWCRDCGREEPLTDLCPECWGRHVEPDGNVMLCLRCGCRWRPSRLVTAAQATVREALRGMAFDDFARLMTDVVYVPGRGSRSSRRRRRPKPVRRSPWGVFAE